MDGKYRLTTLGCKVNQYESQQIRETLDALGLQPADPADAADLAVVNTCAVTVSASRKSRQYIRRLARGGALPTVVVGCYATAAADALARIPGVLAVLGHDRDVCRELRRIVSCRLGATAESRVGSGAMACPPAPDANPPAGETRLRDDAAPGDRARTQSQLSRSHPPRSQLSTRGADQHAATAQNSIPGPGTGVKNGLALDETIHAFDGHQRAFLKVQDGCDAFCTYCIIPQLRPILRSKTIETAVAEARRLVKAGHREIVVTGIYLGAFGRSTAIRRRYDTSHSPLADLVEALAGVDGLVRLRLSSLEPGDVDDRLLDAMRRNDACVPHLHLPLQAGSDVILKRMNRQYTTGQYLGMVDRVREALIDPAISTDIVVGFPGESDADFGHTLDVVRQVGFCKIHAFPFSPREGTPAARRAADFVPPEKARERMRTLLETERNFAERFIRGRIGSVERVIVEAADVSDAVAERPAPAPIRHGRTDRYFEVTFPATAAAGDVLLVRIDAVTDDGVWGTLVDGPL